MQYCYDIKYDGVVNEDAIKKFVQKIYTNKTRFKDNAFDVPEDDLPYVTIYSKPDQSVCILLTSKGKKNLEKIDEIHNRLRSSDLTFEGITLSKPYLFDVDAQTWFSSASKPKTDGKRWDTLRHNGPYFTHISEPYVALGGSLGYDGKEYKLSSAEEKIARYYANRLISEAGGGVTELWTKDAKFNQNFFKDFQKYLSPEHKNIFKDFKKLNFKSLVNLVETNKESKKTTTKAEKRAKKVLDEEKKRVYAYGFIDGNREKLGNYNVEPGAIFYGRGANPNRGKIKPEIRPEDVTINIGKNDPIPSAPPGRKWGSVVHDKSGVWAAKWTDPISGEIKYIMFAQEGKFKGEGDFVKYEKARKLNFHLQTVRDGYMKDAASSNGKKKQLGTILYLIDRFGLRVGNEKSAEEVDTIGASTLRVGNVKVKPPNHIIFDFLGKDSIRFYKDLKVDMLIFENFKRLLAGKKKDDDVFDLISAKDINSYLKQFDKSFSAKVFRTRLASVLMYNALKDVKIPPGSTKSTALKLFNKANVVVADTLNHTKTISKKAEESVKKDKEKLKEKEQERREKKKDGKSLTAIDKSIATLKNKIEGKSDTMAVAIGTSLTNYIDPRLIVSWAESQNTPIEYIYTATLMKKFNWAISTTDKDWDYLTSPLIGNPELEPVEEGAGTASTRPARSPTRRSRRQTPVNIDDPSYQIFLDFCLSKGNGDFDPTDISDEAWEWIYPFSKHITDEGLVENPTAALLTDIYENMFG